MCTAVEIVRRFITVHTTSIQHSYVLCGPTVVCVCVLLTKCCHVFVYLLPLETPIFRIMNLIKTCATYKVISWKYRVISVLVMMVQSACAWTFSWWNTYLYNGAIMSRAVGSVCIRSQFLFTGEGNGVHILSLWASCRSRLKTNIVWAKASWAKSGQLFQAHCLSSALVLYVQLLWHSIYNLCVLYT